MAIEQSGPVAAAAVTPTVTHTWMKIEQAATVLKVSHRTIHRRISNRELESRLDDSGRRMVLVTVNPPADSQQLSPDQMSVSRNDSHVTAAAGGVAGADLMTVMEFSPQARETLAMIVRCHTAQARRARRAAVLGWAVAAAASVAVAATLTVSASRASYDRAQVENASQRLAQEQTATLRMTADRDRVLVELGRALAQVDAQMATAQIAAAPATQPVKRVGKIWVLERLAGVFEAGQ